MFAGLVPIGDINAVTRPLSRIVALPNLYYPWDVPSAAFVLLLIACVLRLRVAPTAGRSPRVPRRSPFIASLNRETAVLLVPLSVWAVWRSVARRAGRSVALAAAQVIAWAGLMARDRVGDAGAGRSDKATLPGGVVRVVSLDQPADADLPALRADDRSCRSRPARGCRRCSTGVTAPPGRTRRRDFCTSSRRCVVAITFGVLHETRIFTEAGHGPLGGGTCCAGADAVRPAARKCGPVQQRAVGPT